MRTWLAALAPVMLAAQTPAESYRVENVPLPREVAPEVAAIAFAQDGTLAACFRRGYIYLRAPGASTWRRFAHGLQTPLGILPGGKGEFFVVHLPELTRVADTDGDGVADVYETISDAWGMSGNYHEFTYGPVRDAQGNFYVSLGSASNGAEPRPPVRGALTTRGRQAREAKEGGVNRVGHYSPVSYRGSILKIAPSGEAAPLAFEFRQPNGLGFNETGDGAFYGHPSSLNWDPSFRGQDPVESSVEALAKRRKIPAIQFPQNDMAGSVAQPLLDSTQGKFGPYAGQFLVAEWTYPRILRADLEKVGGEYQGACFILVDGNGLRTGNNRIALSPDGASLYVAQTSRIWGSAEGLQRIVFTGKTPMDILRMRLTRSGFELTFTQPVDADSAANPANYSFTHYYYLYHSQYGSPKTDVTPVRVTAADVSGDRLRVRLTLEKLVPGRIYELRPGPIRGAGGQPLATRIAAYTLNRLL